MRPRNCYCCGELHGWKCPSHQGALEARRQDVAWFRQHPDEDVLERELTLAETLNRFNLTSAVVNRIRQRRVGNKVPNTSPGWSIETDRVWFHPDDD